MVKSVSSRHLCRSLSGTHDVDPLPAPGRSRVEKLRPASPELFCVSLSLSLSLHNCFPPGQLLASSAVNLTIIICPPFTSSHEK